MQSNEVTWYEGNELTLDIVAPIDYADPSTPVVMDSGTATGYLFERDGEGKMASQAAASQPVLNVVDGTLLTAADRVVVLGNDNKLYQHEVDSIVDNAVTLTANLTQIVAAGSPVRKVAGTQAPLVVTPHYGTASLASTEWGYVIPIDHAYAPDIPRDRAIEAYVTVEKAATSALYSKSWDVLLARAKGAP